MLSLLLDDGLDDNRMVDAIGSDTLDARERSADIYIYICMQTVHIVYS